MQLYRFIY